MVLDRERAREQLKGQLRAYVEIITEASRGANMYVCPLCGSGTGNHRTGAFSLKDDTSWKCFACNESGDIFDLIGKVENLAGYSEQLARAGEIFGIEVNSRVSSQNAPAEYQKQTINKQSRPKEAQAQDFTDFFLQANKDLNKTDYHRGISRDTLDHFQVGYVSCWTHPKVLNAPASPRLIIPTSRQSYFARDTRENIPEEQRQYAKQKVGNTHIFNIEALKNTKRPIFVVEGEIDALSIIDAGGEAIGLGTTAMVDTLLKLIKYYKPAEPLILALDNDARGMEAQAKLETGLKELQIPFYVFNPAKGYKDANEALQANKEAFKQAVERGEKYYLNEYLAETNARQLIHGFLDAANEFAKNSAIPTGYPNLDALLDGGLYPGIYVIGAISSLGKTTFSLQMADAIAQAGHDVLIFSLEMSKHELMAKTLSRISKLEDIKNNSLEERARPARNYLSGKWCVDNAPDEEIREVYRILDIYYQWADKVFIIEGSYSLNAIGITNKVKKHISITGHKPVVIVDYLQILAPLSDKYTDKQNVDRSIVELKRLSRDLKLPVITISSFNRDSYATKASMSAFKESGAIEYTSDVLIGLQFQGMSENASKFDVDAAKKSNPREIELLLIKNRHGQCGEVRFKYYPKFNLFTPA